NSTNTVNTASILVNTASIPVNTVSPTVNTAGTNNDKSDWPFTSNATSLSFVHSDALFNDPNMSHLEDISIFGSAYDDRGEGAEADTNNLEPLQVVSLIPSTRVHKDHPKEQILGDPFSALQTRRMLKKSAEHAMVSYISKQRRTNHKDF
ncbi:hypothetical protein Tco_0258418, partial [Tanacetum coccineum]